MVQRFGTGPLTLEAVSAAGERLAGVVFDMQDRRVASLGSPAGFRIDSLDARAARGEPFTMPLEQEDYALDMVGTVPRELDLATGIVRSARVAMLHRSRFRGGMFEVRTVPVELGDAIVADETEGALAGVIRADDQPALSIAARVIAHGATVRRAGGSQYVVTSTLVDAIRNDPGIQTFLVAIGVLWAMLKLWESAAKYPWRGGETK